MGGEPLAQFPTPPAPSSEEEFTLFDLIVSLTHAHSLSFCLSPYILVFVNDTIICIALDVVHSHTHIHKMRTHLRVTNTKCPNESERMIDLYINCNLSFKAMH